MLCTVTADRAGNVSVSSVVRQQTVKDDQGTRIWCGRDEPLAHKSITATGVIFDVGGSPITVAPGTTAAVGPYQVTVTSISRGTAVFTMG